jgi:hypothetical protein
LNCTLTLFWWFSQHEFLTVDPATNKVQEEYTGPHHITVSCAINQLLGTVKPNATASPEGYTGWSYSRPEHPEVNGALAEEFYTWLSTGDQKRVPAAVRLATEPTYHYSMKEMKSKVDTLLATYPNKDLQTLKDVNDFDSLVAFITYANRFYQFNKLIVPPMEPIKMSAKALGVRNGEWNDRIVSTVLTEALGFSRRAPKQHYGGSCGGWRNMECCFRRASTSTSLPSQEDKKVLAPSDS